jgi:signal transduction histidine kinase
VDGRRGRGNGFSVKRREVSVNGRPSRRRGVYDRRRGGAMRSVRGWLLYLAAWLPFAALWGALVWLGRHSVGFALAATLGMMGTAALLGVAVWWASGRCPWPAPGRAGRAQFVGLHLAGAFGFNLLLISMDAVLGAHFEKKTPLAFLLENPRWLLWECLVYSWLYGLLAGVAYALRAQERLRAGALAAARAEALAMDAQLRALRAQLNPHFLFNALHSLGALVHHDRAGAEEALDRLGELLRYALDEAAGDTVALAEEWAFVRNYLALETLRLGPRLRVEAELDEEALECRVPPFVLQPLVENAVRHAVAPRVEGGCVTISARMEGGALVICVQDDGPGANPEAAERGKGLGLRALRERIATRLEIATAPGKGFRATVTLPARAASLS